MSYLYFSFGLHAQYLKGSIMAPSKLAYSSHWHYHASSQWLLILRMI